MVSTSSPLLQTIEELKERAHRFEEEEKTGACGCMNSRIGEEVSEQLDIIPGRIQVIRNIRYKYVCKSCEGVGAEEPAVKIASLPKQLMRKGMVGIRNWLFLGHPNGARASAALYSLIETAKANNLEPYQYLRYLFERLPLAKSEEDYKALLPNRLVKDQVVLASQWADKLALTETSHLNQ